MSDLVGQSIAGYPLQKLLNRGAYDELYQAASSGAPLGIRVLRGQLRQDAALNTAVAKGWEAARAIAHPNLVTVYSAGVDLGAGAYSLEEAPPGKPLRQMILGGAKVAWRDCLVLAEQLFAALQALHAGQVCHGCLWSGGVLITQDQDLKIEGACGLSAIEAPLTEIVSGPAIGYLAPEIVQDSPVSPESDIYSAGACVYSILAGQDPYPGEDQEVLARHVLERDPAPLAGLRDDVPPEAEEFIARLMAKDPTQRYGRVDDVLADVVRLKSGQALAPLTGGRPAAPPRVRESAPQPAPQPAPPQRTTGIVPPPAAAAVGLAGVGKAPAGTRVVFGRLETHVKSTIPQSDTEKRGDDLYRQGQLPLALATWKDAYLNATPHAALKIKIEFGEREAKKEAYSLALDEARYRLSSRDYKSAIGRAREAVTAAENDEQRQEAVKIEREARVREEEEAKRRSIKTAICVILGVAALIAVLLRLARAPVSVEDESAVPSPPETTKGVTPAGPADSRPGAERLVSDATTVILPPPWTVSGSEACVRTQGTKEIAATLRITKCPLSAKAADKRNELRNGGGLKNAEKCDDWENIGGFIDGLYPCSELGFRYTEGGKVRYHYYYLVSGPGDVLYQAEFDGREDLFTPDLRAQMRQIMQSLTYHKK